MQSLALNYKTIHQRWLLCASMNNRVYSELNSYDNHHIKTWIYGIIYWGGGNATALLFKLLDSDLNFLPPFSWSDGDFDTNFFFFVYTVYYQNHYKHM